MKCSKRIYTVSESRPEMTEEEREKVEQEIFIYLMKTMDRLNKEQEQKEKQNRER